MCNKTTPLEDAIWKTQEVLAILRNYEAQRALLADEVQLQEATQLYNTLQRTLIRCGELMDRMWRIHHQS